MIILEPDDLKNGIVVNAAQALDDDECYAMLDSGANAIIAPLHPRMEGEVAECQVPSATVTGPIVQVYEFEGKERLVVALPNSAILVSQEGLTNIAGWTFVSGPKPGFLICYRTLSRELKGKQIWKKNLTFWKNTS